MLYSTAIEKVESQRFFPLPPFLFFPLFFPTVSYYLPLSFCILFYNLMKHFLKNEEEWFPSTRHFFVPCLQKSEMENQKRSRVSCCVRITLSKRKSCHIRLYCARYLLFLFLTFSLSWYRVLWQKKEPCIFPIFCSLPIFEGLSGRREVNLFSKDLRTGQEITDGSLSRDPT